MIENARMIENVRVAVVGVGNNTSALVQGIAYYRRTGSLVGLHRPEIGGLGVGDVDVVTAFARSDAKVGKDLHEAVFLPPNNFPALLPELAPAGVTVQRGLVATTGIDATGIDRIAAAIDGADVLLYSAPSGRTETARAYAEAALAAGVAFINTTSDPIARDSALLDRYAAAGVPLVGDDLASQFGSSVVHRALLRLLEERGVTLVSSYQVNLGGTEDFRNLVETELSPGGGTKKRSKLNAVGPYAGGSGKVAMAPLGYLPHLASGKVTYLNVEAQGWGGTPVSLDVKLKVHDPSGAAGVNIDLIRIAALARRAGQGGYPAEVAALLKSPPGTAV